MENYYNPKEATHQFAATVQNKMGFPLLKFCILSTLGGAFIAFGGLLSVIVAGGISGMENTHPGLIRFLAGVPFPVGLIMVSITGADLFTSNCAAFTLSNMKRKINWVTMGKYLLLSYTFNFIGVQIVAILLNYEVGLLAASPWVEYLHRLAEAKVNLSFTSALLKGIGANFLVCIAMFMAFTAKDTLGRCIGIWIPIMLFVTLGYEHSIANMFFIPSAMYTGADISWTTFLLDNLLPVTIGNIIGGAGMVGMVFGYLYIKEHQKEA